MAHLHDSPALTRIAALALSIAAVAGLTASIAPWQSASDVGCAGVICDMPSSSTASERFPSSESLMDEWRAARTL
jgi:hypothetical protein